MEQKITVETNTKCSECPGKTNEKESFFGSLGHSKATTYTGDFRKSYMCPWHDTWQNAFSEKTWKDHKLSPLAESRLGTNGSDG